ncbi:hypothetical protein BB559_004933 [Furculomyces boomerangus]|uniref:Zinc/iron permease n=1 Tax=Furculomyces boomerangus TaxID=61424 RepID=A0A2T9YBX7_9FUNG|nr:hypothetical protein BB559_004933 [Furculomyces boomerangus]
METACLTGKVSDWSLKAQLIAMGCILVFGGLGSTIPILGHVVPKLHINKLVLELAKFFGIGVIFSTAMVHIFATGVQRLNSPCVDGMLFFGSSKTSRFRHSAEVIFLASLLFMHFLETIVELKLNNEKKSVSTLESQEKERIAETSLGTRLEQVEIENFTNPNQNNTDIEKKYMRNEFECTRLQNEIEMPSSSLSNVNTNQNGELIVMDLGHREGIQNEHNINSSTVQNHWILGRYDTNSNIGNKEILSGDENGTGNFSNYVLELSVASHSVIVGLTLGLTSRKETATLTIALSFHQFFEGVSMGDRLTLPFPKPLYIFMAFESKFVWLFLFATENTFNPPYGHFHVTGHSHLSQHFISPQYLIIFFSETLLKV